jgi:hypothetical protein
VPILPKSRRAILALSLRLGCAALTGLVAGLPRPARCADTAAVYEAWWAGLPAGEIRLALHDPGPGDPAGYRDAIAIRSTGLPWLMTRFRGSAVSDGRDAGSNPVPARYAARYDLRKAHGKRLSMVFEVRTGDLVADRGPDDTSKKPPLAERFRIGVLDPLSAINGIRDQLRRGNRGTFRVPVYDGARRFDVVARVLPPRADDKTLHLELNLAPIAGFKGESSDDGDPDNAPRPVALAISDDSRLMPLSMRVSLYFLPLVVRLSRWCDSASSCGL